MTTRTRYILLLALGAFVLLGCVDLDIDRSGFEATATAAPRTEMARR